MSSRDNTPPPAPGKTGAPDFLWLFLRYDGRIGREVYWLGIGLIWSLLLVVVGLFAGETEEETIGGGIILVGLIALWAEVALLVKRLHDRDLPGFWAALAFVPLVGAAWVVLAGLMPGNAGPNSYGPGPDRRGH